MMFGECHAHIALNGTDFPAAKAQHAAQVDESAIRRCFEAYRARDISFIRDGGDAWGVSHRAREIATEYGIDYRTPVFAIHKKGHYGSIVGRSFDTLMDYAALVEEAADQGADFIKIMTTGIMDFNQYGAIVAGDALTAAEVKEMVHIAHEQGFAVMSHTNGAEAVMNAIEAGVDSIEHGNYLDKEAIQALFESQTAFLPTATVARNLIGTGRFDDTELTRIWEASQASIKAAFEAQVILALGSDAGAIGVLHGQGLLDEYASFKSVIADAEALDERLCAGEAFIKETFRRK